MPGRRKPSFRIDQRTQVLEAVGGHETRRGKLPQRIFDNARELPRVGNDVSQKRRAAAAQGLEHLAGGAGQPLFPVRRLAACGRRAAAASSSHGASCRRNKATGADLVGRTRRVLLLFPLS